MYPRERGTLESTLPKPALILSIFFLCCTAISSVICLYSCNFYDTTKIKTDNGIKYEDVIYLFEIVSKTALGVLSSIMALLYRDPWLHTLVMSMVIQASVNERTKRYKRQ
jgi:hypothetical protein